MDIAGILPFVLTVYILIGLLILTQFLRGLQRTRACFTCRTWLGFPRFTVREPNGRFKANRVGILYIATQGI